MEFRRRLTDALGDRVAFEARGLPGTPDAVIGDSMLAVFFHGCFWHRCPIHGSRPRSARWVAKLARNVRRDRRAAAALRRLGWRVVVVWEHDLPTSRIPGRVLSALARTR
jgi:DNA mismatch endonuclease (patch repair protein)